MSQAERLLTPAEVGTRIGGLCASDVRVLIRAGKISAKRLVVRGTNKMPRLVVLESEVERYMRDMEDYIPKDAPAHSGKQSKVRKPRRGNLSDVHEFV